MNQNIKLVAIDVDGTLLNSRHELTVRTKFLVNRLVDLGIKVCLATGKQYKIIKPLIAELNISGPQITSDGAVVINPLNDEVLYDKRVPKEWVVRVIKLAEKLGVTIVLARDGETITKELNEDIEYMLGFGDPFPKLMKDLTSALDSLPTHIMIIGRKDPELFSRSVKVFRANFGDMLGIYLSSANYMELVHPEVSKGNALKIVADYYGVTGGETLAIGDGDNDVPMFKFSKISIAMGTSAKQVKKLADYITSSSDDDGLAVILEKVLGL